MKLLHRKKIDLTKYQYSIKKMCDACLYKRENLCNQNEKQIRRCLKIWLIKK